MIDNTWNNIIDINDSRLDQNVISYPIAFYDYILLLNYDLSKFFILKNKQRMLISPIYVDFLLSLY